MSIEMNNILPAELDSEVSFQLETFTYTPSDIIVIRYKYDKISYANLNLLYNHLTLMFPNNKIMAIPSDIALGAQDKESLLKWLNE